MTNEDYEAGRRAEAKRRYMEQYGVSEEEFDRIANDAVLAAGGVASDAAEAADDEDDED